MKEGCVDFRSTYCTGNAQAGSRSALSKDHLFNQNVTTKRLGALKDILNQ